MEKTVGAFEAKTHFSELLERAEKGEEIVITKRGKVVARLVPAQKSVDATAVRAVLDRMRKRAKTARIDPPITWDEWKRYRDEGRR
jgi:prevent-host-death family protein